MLRHQNPAIRVSPHDAFIFANRRAAFEARETLIGHYVLVGGVYDRITHQGSDAVQAGGVGGSYYIDNDGVSYSGGLDHSYKIGALELTDKTKPGNFWFFHDDSQRAHNVVHCVIECRVYKVKGE